ncbi:PTS sugar transporter subunit IIC [Oenococcus alcoholitolerans]|uniref:PTS sugar transporter subunit IIC n=1 Tax=Oenococcus alcoholitolerans TaxID=931074 RepID=UPI003F706619
MKSLLNNFQNSLGKLSIAFNKNIYINAIKDGMLAYMPFTVITSVFLIIGNFPIPQVNKWLASLFNLSVLEWQNRLGIVNDASLGVGGLLVLIAVSRNLADKMKINGMQVTLTSLVSFLAITPYNKNKGLNFLDVSTIGAQSIFLAIIVAILVCIIYRWIDKKGIKIKMPDSVPPAVSSPFESLIPSFVVISIFWILRILLDTFVKQSALSLINIILGTPLKAMGGSLIGIIVVKIFGQLLWFFGIHGDSIVNGVMTPIFQVLQDENKNASLAGKIVPNIISQSFWDGFASIGVIGSIFAIVIIAKSKQYKQMKKIAAIPYLFNIGEPTLFGIPLMLNVSYFIPLVFSNTVSIIVSYLAFYWHLVPLPTGLVQVPWTTPIVISGYLVTGSVSGSILQLICFILVVLIWIPFVKIEDNNIYKKENKQQNG